MNRASLEMQRFSTDNLYPQIARGAIFLSAAKTAWATLEDFHLGNSSRSSFSSFRLSANAGHLGHDRAAGGFDVAYRSDFYLSR
jgi:hypothetical protein